MPITDHAHAFDIRNLSWRLRATFAGNLPPRRYLTPDVRFTNPGWDSEDFNRRIEQLEFFLPTGHKIVLAGMEAYNFFIEATQRFSRKGGARIEAFWLCGKIPSPATSEIRHPTSRCGASETVRWSISASRGGKNGAAPLPGAGSRVWSERRQSPPL